VDYGNNKITQHALKMTVMASFVALTEEEEKEH